MNLRNLDLAKRLQTFISSLQAIFKMLSGAGIEPQGDPIEKAHFFFKWVHPAIILSCHPVMRSCSHPVIRLFCHPVILASSHPVILPSFHPVILWFWFSSIVNSNSRKMDTSGDGKLNEEEFIKLCYNKKAQNIEQGSNLVERMRNNFFVA